MWQREIFVKREIVEDNEERFFDKIFLTREKIFCHGMEGWRAHGLIHVVGSEEDWSPTQVGKVFDDGEPLLTCIINIRDQTCGPEIFSRPKIGLTFKNKRFRTIVKWDSHKSGWEPLWDWTQTKVAENHCKWALKKFLRTIVLNHPGIFKWEEWGRGSANPKPEIFKETSQLLEFYKPLEDVDKWLL